MTPGTAEAYEVAGTWVQDVAGLVSPPDVCIKIFDIIDSPGTTSKDIGQIISQDPNLTAQLLRLVNSPAFFPGKKVDTISRAVTIVGIHELYSLIIAVSAVKTFHNIPKNIVNIDTFWRHSLYTGLICRILSQRCNVLHPERLFVAGLLHDIGNMVIYNRIPEIARDLLQQSKGNEDTLYRAEMKSLGFTHADLGYLLLKRWNLPDTLREAVRWHHEPAKAPDTAPIEACLLHIGNALANRSEIGGFIEFTQGNDQIDPCVWSTLHINEQAFDAEGVIGEAGQLFAATASLFNI